MSTLTYQFKSEEAAYVHSFVGKILSGVNYYFWRNESTPGSVWECLDCVELQFNAFDYLFVGIHPNEPILQFKEFNFNHEKEQVLKSFRGKIKLFKEVATTSETWRAAYQKPLVDVVKPAISNGTLVPGSLIFVFESEKIEIAPSYEGIEVFNLIEE